MGTNFYATFPKHERWPPALPQDVRIHLFKRSGAGRGRLKFTWAADPFLVSIALHSMSPNETPFDGDDECVGDVLDEMVRVDTIHDYELIGDEFS